MKMIKFTLIALLIGIVFAGCNTQQIQVKTPQKIESQNKNISILALGENKIHTFHSISNSHIIETPNKLILIDAQINFILAKQVKSYIEGLNKPLDRVILSHAHPDHWFGAEIFKGVKITTTKNIVKDINKDGKGYINRLKKMMPGIIPTQIIKSQSDVVLGAQSWDGLDVIVEEYQEQEAHNSIVVKIPEYGVLIGQDLFYKDTHLVASSQSGNSNWINILESFDKNEAKNYQTILVGHGKNSGTEVFSEDIEYLNKLDTLIQSNLTQEKAKKALLEIYPKHEQKFFVDITVSRLFK